jgi:hypothetical protein
MEGVMDRTDKTIGYEDFIDLAETAAGLGNLHLLDWSLVAAQKAADYLNVRLIEAELRSLRRGAILQALTNAVQDAIHPAVRIREQFEEIKNYAERHGFHDLAAQ